MMYRVQWGEEIKDTDWESEFEKILRLNRHVMFKNMNVKSNKSNIYIAEEFLN